MSEEQKDDSGESVDVEVKEPKAVIPKNAGAKALGRLAGAAVAIPTAALVFGAAGWAGLPATTAISRSLWTAVGMWFFVSWSTRFLFTFVLHDWRKKMVVSDVNDGVRA